MKLYDGIIKEVMETVGKEDAKRLPLDKNWTDVGQSELVMQRDSAYELGGSGKPSVNFTCVTTSGEVKEDEILLIGKDLSAIRGNVSFARIVILETDDLGETAEDTEGAYSAIRDMEFARYHVYPKGYMVRVSSQSNQEEVRLSCEAISGGIDFAAVGKLYIEKYKAIDKVKNVRVIFITDNDALVETLRPNAKKVDDITDTLTHIFDGMATDCGSCNMKTVCDEVEGMKELHLGKKNVSKREARA